MLKNIWKFRNVLDFNITFEIKIKAFKPSKQIIDRQKAQDIATKVHCSIFHNSLFIVCITIN